MIWSVAPVSAPLKAWNGEPGSTLITTGAPVIAACFAGSVYIAKRLSAGAGRMTDWEMMVRMGHSPRLQESGDADQCTPRGPGAASCPLGDYILPTRPVSLKRLDLEDDALGRTIAHHRPKTVTKPLPGASAGYAPERRSQRELLRPL